MVDRYTLTTPADELSASLNVSIPEGYKPRYNAAPTQFLPVISLQDPKKIALFQWGLISNLSNNKNLSPRLFNLPIESALARPTYRKSLNSNRCVILADGFYVWKPIAKKQSTPYYITTKSRKPFFMAGIWEESDPFAERSSRSFMLITVSANDALQSYQEDMPLILDTDLQKTWNSDSLSIDNLSTLITNNSSPEFIIHAVSPMITKIEWDIPEQIQPTNPSDQHGNYTLFG